MRSRSGAPALVVTENEIVGVWPASWSRTSSRLTFRPCSCVDCSGTTCAPGTEMSNSCDISLLWQALHCPSWNAPGGWLVPGGPAIVVCVEGFTSSWQVAHAAAAGLVL